MGSSASKQTAVDDEKVCIDCDKKTQKELPASDGLSSEGMPCEAIYARVGELCDKMGFVVIWSVHLISSLSLYSSVTCMDEHKGQSMCFFYYIASLFLHVVL